MTFSTGWCRSSQAQDAEEGKAYSWKVWYRRNECETRPGQWPWYIFSGGWVWSGHFRWRGEVTYTSLSFFFFLLRVLNKIMQKRILWSVGDECRASRHSCSFQWMCVKQSLDRRYWAASRRNEWFLLFSLWFTFFPFLSLPLSPFIPPPAFHVSRMVRRVSKHFRV